MLKKYKKQIEEACHVQDLDKWIKKELDVFNIFTKELSLDNDVCKKLEKMFLNGLISYNAIDSITDGESSPKDLNVFLFMLLDYRIIFDDLSKKMHYLYRDKIELMRNGIDKHYLKCSNNPQTMKWHKIQGTRSVPYILPYITALFLSNQNSNLVCKDLIRGCFVFCGTRQTSDDLKDLRDDILNEKKTLVVDIYKHFKNTYLEDDELAIKLKTANQVYKFLEEEFLKLDLIFKNNSLLIFKYWHQSSKLVLERVLEYKNILENKLTDQHRM